MVMKQEKWYVYILQCLDNLYYVGLTRDISNRYNQHLSGLGSRFTAKHGVKKLAYVEYHDDFDVARAREKQIKDWNRSKKEKLINGEWTNL